MARMYPQRLPDTVESSAEGRLFDALEGSLDQHFTVFAGVRWLRKHKFGATPGEADFVIAHPDRGIIVLEVKGGGIHFDGDTGQWHSRDRYGQLHVIKNPVEQAQRNFYDLRDKMREIPAASTLQFSGGHAVAFPDGMLREQQLRPDLPREIVIDASDVDALQPAIERIFACWTTNSTPAIGKAGINALVSVLGRSWEIPFSLLQAIRSEQDRMRTLTEDQFSLLDFLAGQQRALITGCAGSGKTFLAAEKARRLANEGFKTLLTCYNKNLAAWMRSSMSPLPETLRIQHFHELAQDLVEQAGIPGNVVDDADLGEYFAEILPERLLDATDLISERFDAIVVDEGQDFHEEWWVPLQALLTHPDESVWYVFYDAEQCIYTQRAAPPFDGVPFLLSANLRNTQAIHEHVKNYYSMPVTCRGPEGRPPTLTACTDPRAELQRRLHELVNVEKISPADIVVLTPANKQRSQWAEGTRLGNLTLTWSPDPGRAQVRVSTIHSFKGLESPVIIVTEMESASAHQPADRLRLVAYSRAKSELYVIDGAA